MPTSRRAFLTQATLGAGLAAVSRVAGGVVQAEDALGTKVTDQRTVLDISTAGRHFATYNYNTAHAGLYRPFFHPVRGPNDRPITQEGEFPGTLRGHYWHRALFVAHQKVNGISFWEERQADCGKMAHVGFDEITSGPTARIVQRLAWRDLAGQDLLLETRTIRIPPQNAAGRCLDIGIRLRAVREQVTFEKTPYNLLACRVINAMCRVQEKQQYTKNFGRLVDFAPLERGGAITNSEGERDDGCRGKRARWCDFSGPLDVGGAVGGIALLDHPANPRHPTPWHNWNNMTITASLTFHEPLVLKKDQELRLCYRVFAHSDDAAKADVERAWNAFAKADPA